MKKTCSLFIFAYLILFAAYYWFLRSRIESPGFLILAVLGAAGMLFMISGIAGFFTESSDRTVLMEASKGKRAPQDGKKSAATGSIQATGLTLCRSPLTNEECVAYEYQVRVMDASGNPVDYFGFGMCPCAVQSPLGNVRLLSFPVLEGFSWEKPQDQSVAQAYIAGTKFKEVGLNQLAQTFEDVFTDKDGIVKTDARRKSSKRFMGQEFQQRIVRPGTQVCALGRYSAKDQGLLGEMGVHASMNRLYPGSAEQVASSISREFRVTFRFGLMFFLLIHAMLFVIVKYRYLSYTPDQRFSKMQLAAQEHDFDELGMLLNSGFDVNQRDSDGQTLLMVNHREPDVEKFLIEHHADVKTQDPKSGETALFWAVREGPPEVVKMLIDAGSDVNAVGRIPEPHTPLDEAIRAERPDVQKMLLDAGARDSRISAANGQPVQADDDVVRTYNAYITAIGEKDIDALMRLEGLKNRKALEDADFKFWQNSRIPHPSSLAGYKNDTAATVKAQGKAADGSDAIWWYQFKKSPAGEWMIEREWSETPHR